MQTIQSGIDYRLRNPFVLRSRLAIGSSLPASARVLALPGVAFCELQDVKAVSELVVVHRRHERSAAVRALLAGLRSMA